MINIFNVFEVNTLGLRKNTNQEIMLEYKMAGEVEKLIVGRKENQS